MDNYVEIDRTTEQLEKAIDMTNSEELGENAVTYGMEAEAEGDDSIAIGQQASSAQGLSVAIGNYAQTTAPQGVAEKSIAIGANATAAADEAIQIGDGTNDVSNTTKIKNTTILDTNGKIPFSALQGGEVVGLSVNSSNHLIVTYANGESADLGAIGGGSGTTDYEQLTNKPQVNGNTLSGNKTGADLGLQALLQSGTNIKTINGASLLGSGDLSVSISNVPSVFYELITVDDVLQELQTGVYYAPNERYFGLEGEGSFYVPNSAIIIVGDNGLTSISDIISYSDGVDVYSSMTDFDIKELLDEKQDVLTFDSAPTSGSENPVTSGGVYTAQASKQDVNVQLTIGQSKTQTQTVTQWLQGFYDEVAGATAIVSDIEGVIGE